MLGRSFRTGRGSVSAALVVAVAAGIIAVASSSGSSALLPKNAIRLDVGGNATGSPIQPWFIGLSTEYTSLESYAGSNPRALSQTFIKLVENLAPGASPVIRIGGDSTDWTWWPPGGGARPPWARYALTPRWLAVARSLALATGGHLIIGINFEADSRQLAGAEAGAMVRGIGRRLIDAFELGNEPEVYSEIGWYNDARGVGVLGRPTSYGFRGFLPDFRAVSSALPAGVPIAGPALALTWPLSTARPFLASNPRVRTFTFHFYPLKRCFNPLSSPTFPTLAHLLDVQSGGPPPGTAAAVAAAHARGVLVRVDELNSVSCRGLGGLSDSFASALWIVDALFHLARAGVDGVNIHTLPHVSYQPFSFDRSGGRMLAQVKPMYYGLMLFARAAPAGSRLLPTIRPPDNQLRTWATRASTGAVRLVMINDSPVRSLTVAVRLPRPAARATVAYLTAPGLTARGGVRLAGQSFTTSATLAGNRHVTVLQAIQSRYLVRLAPASAALLTMTPS